MQPLDRDEEAPRAGPELWVRRLIKNESITFCSCSQSVWKFWIHWDPDSRKSSPCFKNHKQCPGHRRGLARKWRGYLFGCNETARRYEFLEITPATMETLNAMVGFLSNFRGQRWTLKRGDADTARIKVTSLQALAFDRVHDFPEDKDPQETLLRLWGYEGDDPGKGSALAD